MQTPSIHKGQAGGLPLTHQAYIAACGTALPRPWVQVRRRFSGDPVVLCGQVGELGSNEGDWFKVATCVGELWTESRNVRMCSGDGRCTCEGSGMADQTGEGC
jgi:hypothetical protein